VEEYAVGLLDNRAQPPRNVSAKMVRSFPADKLSEVEALWSPARQEVAIRRELDGEPIEHGHWDWKRKTEQAKNGATLLSAVVMENEVQGLIGVSAKPRSSVLHPGKDALYVDYLEVAPWNLGVGGAKPRHSGAGTLLMVEAVLLSEARQMGGRVGLHSLSQAESFYVSRRMTRLGSDPDYYDLAYFEYYEAVAMELLARARKK